MIGQKNILSYVDNLIEKGFPRFIVITGQKGQGKTELAKYISKKLDIQMVEIGIKIDAIREMIEMAYKQTEPIVYLIQNADRMSLGAKNSLLKVIEEPPNNIYFIMELQQIENTLPTIKSRCQELKMELYSDIELQEMINQIVAISDSEERKIISQVAGNYYQIELLASYRVKPFYNYVEKVYDNIYKVQSANSFKIAEKLDLKDIGEGYDLELFWNTYIYKCFSEMTENNLDDWDKLSYSIITTATDKTSLTITGINKQSLFDMWILSIRNIWRNM